MTPVSSIRLAGLGVLLVAAACGGSSGGGTGPCTPGAATQLAKSGGDGQAWYFNNPLPAALSVKALDANNCAVPGVVVNWTVASGGGGVSPAQSTTNASGVASTTDSIGGSTPQSVSATPAITTLPTLTFSATAAAPPTSAAVDVKDNFFSPQNAAIKTGGTVTWTWRCRGAQRHIHRWPHATPGRRAESDYRHVFEHHHRRRDLRLSLHKPRWHERDDHGAALTQGGSRERYPPVRAAGAAFSFVLLARSAD